MTVWLYNIQDDPIYNIKLVYSNLAYQRLVYRLIRSFSDARCLKALFLCSSTPNIGKRVSIIVPYQNWVDSSVRSRTKMVFMLHVPITCEQGCSFTELYWARWPLEEQRLTARASFVCRLLFNKTDALALLAKLVRSCEIFYKSWCPLCT